MHHLPTTVMLLQTPGEKAPRYFVGWCYTQGVNANLAPFTHNSGMQIFSPQNNINTYMVMKTEQLHCVPEFSPFQNAL